MLLFRQGMKWPALAWWRYLLGWHLIDVGNAITAYGLEMKHAGLYQRVAYWYRRNYV